MDEIVKETPTEGESKEVEPKAPETEGVESEKEIPAWLSESEEDKMPVTTHLRTKRKLKGVISERDAELEQLKREMQELKANKPQAQPLKRPKLNDFETDEEFDSAMESYEARRDEEIIRKATYTNTQVSQEEKFQREVDKAVDDYNTSADGLIKEYGIDPAVYDSADRNVREAVDAVKPGFGDAITNVLITRLGKGSEKVMYYLGRNKTKLAEFQSMLLRDPNGTEASMFLGEIRAEIKKTTKRNSQAPAPAASVDGDVAPAAGTKASKKQFDKAMDNGDEQTAYQIRKAAKASGVDTKEWS